CVVLPETTDEQAVTWAERMRARISAQQIKINDTTLEVTASFGVAQRVADTSSPEMLVDMAGPGLVVAKRHGGEWGGADCRLAQAPVISRCGDDIASMLHGVPARDAMTAVVAPLNCNDNVATASNYFLRFRIPSAPVVDDNGQLVGILSEKDLMSIMLGPRWW